MIHSMKDLKDFICTVIGRIPRRERRLRARAEFLVSPTDSTNSFQVGQLVDISTEGLSFRYLAVKEQTKGLTALDIFCHDSSDFRLAKIPATVVYDVVCTDTVLFRLLPLRRCGVKFGKLSVEHLSKLEFLIANYAY